MFKSTHFITALTPECGTDIVAWRKGLSLDKTALVQQVKHGAKLSAKQQHQNVWQFIFRTVLQQQQHF